MHPPGGFPNYAGPFLGHSFYSGSITSGVIRRRRQQGAPSRCSKQCAARRHLLLTGVNALNVAAKSRTFTRGRIRARSARPETNRDGRHAFAGSLILLSVAKCHPA